MIPKLKDYERIIGKRKIEAIKENAAPLVGKHVVHINSTSSGGGVAEILNTLVFLMNDLNIDTGWRLLIGSHSFFKITKGIHNSLQGKKWKFTEHRKKIYAGFCKRNALINHIKDHDIVIIHDPQPLALVQEYDEKQNWIWRCHIDMSHPYYETLHALKPYIKRYDAVIVSSSSFKIKHLKKPQFIIPPSIDPLARKNKPMKHEKARKYLSKKGIDTDKPIISQISRFDPWKGQIGVLNMYERIRAKEKCQLVLMGNMADDDPEGPLIYHKIRQKTDKLKDITIITEHNDMLVNALQTMSSFVFQNSIREGFGLTVAEALWKRTPVIATPVGGIPLQVKNGKTGFLINNRKEGVKRGINLLQDYKLKTQLGHNGHEHIKENFLVTRHLQDYISLFKKFYPKAKL
jgi:trehalose synthase